MMRDTVLTLSAVSRVDDGYMVFAQQIFSDVVAAEFGYNKELLVLPYGSDTWQVVEDYNEIVISYGEFTYKIHKRNNPIWMQELNSALCKCWCS